MNKTEDETVFIENKGITKIIGGNPIPLYTHPVKEQSNLVNVVKDHIEDLWRCVKTFRSYEMDNTADEMEVAIKELEDAIEAHPVKELTDEEIHDLMDEIRNAVGDDNERAMNRMARTILSKAIVTGKQIGRAHV